MAILQEQKLIVSLWTILNNPEALRKAGLYALYAALLLRVIWAIAIPVAPVSDSHAYDVFAQNIASGEGFCWKPGEYTAYWAVGTSAIYALLYSVFGHSYLPIVILNVLVGMAALVLAMSLARRWLGEIPAVLTGWILALWPLLIEYTTVLASELLFNLCVLAALWLASMPRWKLVPRAVATGVALAAASYIRPVALLIAPLAYLREAIIQKRLLKAIIACGITSLLMVALILPWSLRNLHVFNHFVLVSTNAGANFWMGNNPQTTGGYMELPKLDIKNEAELDHELNRQAWEYIRQDPKAFVFRSIRKAVVLYDRESIGVSWNEQGIEQRYGHSLLLPLKLWSSGYWYLVLASAVMGTLFLLRYRYWLDVVTLPPLVLWLYFTAIHGITVTGDRYHIPTIPFLAMLAAYGINAAIQSLHKRTTA